MNYEAVNVDHNFSRFIVMIHSDCKAVAAVSTRIKAAFPSGLLQGFCSQSTGRCVWKLFYINHNADQKQLDCIAEGISSSSSSSSSCQSNCYFAHLIITVTEPTSASASSSSRWQAYKTHHVAVSQLTAGSLYVSFEKAAGLNVNPCVNYQHITKNHCILGKQDAASGTKACRFSV